MGALWNAITAGAAPLILSALAMLIPALTGFAVAWLKAQAALQEQAVRSAVDHVDALRGPAVDLSGAEAKATAMRLIAGQLPRVSEKLSAKIAEKIDRVVAEKRAGSVPPPASDATPTDNPRSTRPRSPLPPKG